MNGVQSEGNVPRPLTSIQSSSGRFTRPLFTELLIFFRMKRRGSPPPPPDGRRAVRDDGEWPLDAATSCTPSVGFLFVFFHLILKNFNENLRCLRHLIRLNEINFNCINLIKNFHWKELA